ncbi:MAG TPA: amidohydrolase/deacetylase family metallohydrolase [Bryobacteraceae bacterium]|jgi:dihydroorotase|nr:amidohydrolase/deacetylase family metallohydrolase [Bryobacteraceae bacterium]
MVVKICLALSLLAAALAAQPRYDLLLKGGHVIDPKNNINSVMDVAVADGKIARVAPDIAPGDARTVVNAAGLYVTPGLIDIHAHVYIWREPGGEGIQPDAFSFRSGVTTMVDAGSTGWKTFPDLRNRIISHSETRVLAFLNIVGAGMGTGKENDPAEMDAEAAARTAKANPDVIVGFKSAHYAGPGWESVDNAVKAGNLAGLPVMVDFGRINAVRNINTLLLDKLRPGDIYTHCYSGHRQELLDDGKINPAMIAGRKRGVLFDVGHGAGSFYWYVAVPAYEQNFRPDSISTDIHTHSMNGGMKDMTNVMSKLLNLGSPIEEVVRMSTWNPAKEIRRPKLGNLDVGADADIAVLRVERGDFGFLDSALARRPGDQRIVCELTLRAGKVRWDLNGLASQDWKRFPYDRRSWTH